MHRYPWAASVAAIVMLAVGCSSESDTANDQTDGAGGTSGGSGGAGGSSAGTGGSSAGTGGSSAGTGGSSTGSGGSSTGGTGATGGSGSGATDGGAGTNPTGGAGGTANIQCGTSQSQCSGPSQYCCDNYNEPDECLASGATCVYGVVVECDGPEDCAGQVCCATLFIRGQARAVDNIRCAADCSGNDDRVVCGSSDSCPTGQTCGTSEILPPYRDCK
jgi:hypothetical protein